MSNKITALIAFILFIWNSPVWAQFGMPFTITIDEDIKRVRLADLDSDGNQDVLAATTNGIQWYSNDGSGTYSDAISIIEFIRIGSLTTGDLDGDGDEDIVFQSGGGETIALQWLRNDGNGVFNIADTLLMGWNENYYDRGFNVIVLDVNGDEDLDIVAIWFNPSSGSTIEVYSNNGGGMFSEPITINYRGSFSMDDFNQDGFPDYLFTNTDLQASWISFNDGTGNIDSLVYIQQGVPFSSPFICDIDNDSYPNPILSNFWFRELQGGGFVRGGNLFNRLEYGGPIEATDFNNDGLQDFLSYSSENDLLAWHQYSNYDGLQSYNIANADLQRFPRILQVGDVNSDGLIDVVSLLADGRLVWYRNETQLIAALIHCFWDENENGIYDENEVVVNNFPILLNEHNITYYTNEDGLLYLNLEDGTYSLSVNTQDCWQTVMEDDYNFTWDREQTNIINIPLQLRATDYDVLRLDITSGATNCNQQVPFYLSVLNENCLVEDGLLSLVLDNRVELLPGGTTPTLVDGNTLWWSFEDVIPGQAFKPTIYLEMPDVEFTGDTLSFQWYLYQRDCDSGLVEGAPASDLSEGFETCIGGVYAPIIGCAYDANDKQVSPFRDSVRNLTLFGEELTYTIHFQNTSNDTVFQLYIRDKLDPQLDWSTFKPLVSSHSYNVNLDENSGELTFFFDDILLLDSATDNIGSQGYIKYTIKALPNLSEHSIVSNQARIFFDQLPPVFTNSVSSEMVADFTSLNTIRAFFTFSLEDAAIFLCDHTQGFTNNWSWDFGDGYTSTARNPNHVYAEPGTYTICLIASNGLVSDEYCRTVNTQNTNMPVFTDMDVLSESITNIQHFVAADFNGDRAGDIAVIDQSKLEVYLNDGLGGMQDSVAYGPPDVDYRWLRSGDWDSDGDIDIFALRTNGQIDWYINTGDGIFTDPIMLVPGELAVSSFELIANNTEDALSLVYTIDKSVWVVQKDVNGTMLSPRKIYETSSIIKRLGKGYFNLDKVMDVAIETSNGIELLGQTENEFLLLYKVALLTGEVNPKNRLTISDLNRDGLADLLRKWWNNNTGTIQAFYNKIEDPFLRFVFAASNPGLYEEFTALAVGDMDLDSDKDVLVAGARALKWTPTLAQQEGFGEPIIISNVNSSISQIQTIDMDSDVDQDILVSKWCPNWGQCIAWYRNDLAAQSPIAQFTTLAKNGEYQFEDFSLFGPTTWFWDFGDGALSREQNPSHTYTETGEYQVCLTVTNAAGLDTYCYPIVVDGLTNTVTPALLTSLNLFPNPTSGDIMVALTCAESTSIQLELYNLFGQRLWQSPVTESQELRQPVDLTAYSTGTYLLRLRIGEEWVTRKVVKLE